MATITVRVAEHRDGYTFRLDPRSYAELMRTGSIQVSDMTVSASFTKADFELQHGPLGKHMVMVLTGLSEHRLRRHTVRFIDAVTEKVLHRFSSQYTYMRIRPNDVWGWKLFIVFLDRSAVELEGLR
jgi:hypothetical protein